MGFLAKMTDEQLLVKLGEYAEKFKLVERSGKTPEATDVAQAMNADYLFREAVRRGLVDKDGRVVAHD